MHMYTYVYYVPSYRLLLYLCVHATVMLSLQAPYPETWTLNG